VPTAQRYTFPPSHRLRLKADFRAVFDAGVKQSRGPLAVLAKPNELGHPRIGLSVPRRVGTAPRRNRIKRLLRESFRLMQHDLPEGYDFVVVVRPHEPLILADYQRLLSGLFVKLHQSWQSRS
jgi:ribonuclease P protein component